MTRQHETLWWGASAIFTGAGTALIGLAAAIYSNHINHMWVSGPAIGAYVTSFLAMLCAAGAVRSWRFPLAYDPSGMEQRSDLASISIDQDNVAASLLADEIQKRWKDEAKARRIEVPDLIAVRWQSDEELHGHTLHIDSAISGQINHIEAITDQFLTLAPHRLILVGPPASGKTALAILMMLELLRRYAEGAPVPVMLSLSSWDMQGSLRAWVTRRITSEYKPVEASEKVWAAAVERLMKKDLIIPVLDGLDELAPALRGPALNAINDILPTQPLILACRREEYEEISRHSGPLKNAAGIVALPVTVNAAVTYLKNHSGAMGLESWQPLLDEITTAPASPLAQALSSPLTVSLLPVVYGNLDSDPSELLNRKSYPSAEAIEDRLYEGLLHAYDVYFHFNRSPWNPARAKRWLTELARHLSRSLIYDIAYWQLPHAVTRGQRLLVAVCASLIGGLAASMIPGLIVGMAVGAMTGLLAGALLSLIRSKEGGPKTRLPVASGKTGSALIRGNGPLHTVVFCGLAGLLAGLALHFTIQTYLKASPIFPYSAYLTCLGAVIAGTPIGIPDWQPMIVVKERDNSLSPSRQLASERANNLLFAAGSIVALAGAVGILGWTYGGFAVGFIFGCFASFIIDKLSMAWWSYYLAVAILATRGTFPFRLTEFLDDSYQYGLLRRVGGIYQFAHAGFQDYLAKDLSPEARAEIGGIDITPP